MRIASRVAERNLANGRAYMPTQEKKRLHSYCIVLSLPPEMKTLSELVSPEKQKLNFPRSALFIMKTRVCLIYFLNDNYLIILCNKNYFIVTNNAIAF